MANQYTFLALELARERIHEAEIHNRLMRGEDGFRASGPGLLRRSLARGAAALSRGSAAVAERLDATVAECDDSLRSTRLA
jgi:hypothetical protein